MPISAGGTGAGTPAAAADAIGAFRRGTILGTVSQVAGVPTGAIIENESNANGAYTKFANGLMICETWAFTGYTAANSVNRTFPAVFISAPPGVFINNIPVSGYDVSCLVYANTTTGIFYSSGTYAANVVSICAIGRWF